MQSRYLLGSIAIMGALGFLVTSSLKSGTLQSVPVDELCAPSKEQTFVGKRLRMVGFVGPQKLTAVPSQTDQGVVNIHKFYVVGQAKGTVAVSFSDALPDTFRAGGPVQVDGVYLAPGVMKADHVLTKCPSKYEAGKGGQGAKAAEKALAKTVAVS